MMRRVRLPWRRKQEAVRRRKAIASFIVVLVICVRPFGLVRLIFDEGGGNGWTQEDFNGRNNLGALYYTTLSTIKYGK